MLVGSTLCICGLLLLRLIVPTHQNGGRVHLDVRRGDANDLTSAARKACEEPGRIMGIQPITRASQAIVVEQIGADPSSQQVFDRRVLNVLGHQRPRPIAEPPSIEDPCRGGRSSAHLVTIGRIVLISPGGQASFLAHSRHDPQGVQSLLHVALCCVHLSSSSMPGSPLPHSRHPVNNVRNVGIMRNNTQYGLLIETILSAGRMSAKVAPKVTAWPISRRPGQICARGIPWMNWSSDFPREIIPSRLAVLGPLWLSLRNVSER